MPERLGFKIAKDTVALELCDVFGLRRTAEVFLAEGERVQDVFSSRGFVPVRAGGAIELVSAHHLAYFKLDLLEAIDELDPEVEQADVSTAKIAVYLEGGAKLEGSLRYFLPFGQSRIVDYLSSGLAWIKLRTSDCVYLIPRERVVRVIPLEG